MEAVIDNLLDELIPGQAPITVSPVVEQFIHNRCETGPGKWARFDDLWEAYLDYVRADKIMWRTRLGRLAFFQVLQAAGFRHSRSRRVNGKQRRTIEGIRLIESDLPPAA